MHKYLTRLLKLEITHYILFHPYVNKNFQCISSHLKVCTWSTPIPYAYVNLLLPLKKHLFFMTSVGWPHTSAKTVGCITKVQLHTIGSIWLMIVVIKQSKLKESLPRM